MTDSETRPVPTERPRRYGRGVFLTTVAGGAASLVWGKALWGHASGVVSPIADAVAPILPSGGWRIYTVADHMPSFDAATWRLGVGGLVKTPLDLSYAELKALPRVEQVSTFHCVTGWTVNDVHWAGVRIQDVLDRAQPHSSAHAIEFVSAELPYTDYLTLGQARLHDVLLAYEMDGKPLAREHGAPLRLVIPDMYGYKNVKWLERMQLVSAAGSGYWEQLGYDKNAWVGRSNGYGT